jgi:radical SAM superfamily enzyme YgiQ (UPF0313 family)
MGLSTREAERAGPQVLEDSRHGCLKRHYDGGSAVLDSVQPARHDLLSGGYAMGAIQTTRGCPMNCTFCSVLEERSVSDTFKSCWFRNHGC